MDTGGAEPNSPSSDRTMALYARGEFATSRNGT
jgi:hypothetical protein